MSGTAAKLPELVQQPLLGGLGERSAGERGGERGGGRGEPAAAPPLVHVEGVVKRVTYTAPDNKFAVLQLESPGQPVPVTAIGELAGLLVGETLRVSGQWENHAQYGRRLRATQALPLSPRTLLGMERYLATLTGLGPELARRIMAALGISALELLETETFRVAQVKGVGKLRAARALGDAKARREEREVMVFLQGHGISAAYAVRIRKKYGSAAIAKVKENPYALARDVSGIGFHIADRIAQSVGIDPQSPLRCAAGLHHVLDGAGDTGHCYLPRAELIERTAALLRNSEPLPPPPIELPEPVVPRGPEQLALTATPPPNNGLGKPGDSPPASPGTEKVSGAVPPERIADALDDLIHRAGVVDDQGAIYNCRMHEAEVDLAREVARLLRAKRSRVPTVDVASGGLQLAAGQQAALQQVESAPVCIITGGPGTGKTTIIRTLVSAWTKVGLRVVLTAPTGRAAKRLAEATGHPASTVHRLLAVVPGEDFARRTESDLQADLLVCDEASMLDLQLALTLLRAVPFGATVVLVGDVDQLPSVGPGRVLGDLIESERVPTTRLREIFRQAGGSSIIENAHRILAGQVPLAAPGGSELHDFYLIKTDDAAQARDQVVKLVSERIPARFGLDPLLDVQVLTPMHRGEVGTEELNRVLQAALNPAARGISAAPGAAEAKATGDSAAVLRSRRRSFALGDKVMQVRNDYERDVWNGDVGIVGVVDQEEGTLTVRFDDEREVVYEGDELDQLELAYAVSVHKSQGSEYKAVVIPLHLSHYPLLRRNLLYTAVTRGKRLVVIIGSARALRRAVGETGDLLRYTQLAARLRSILPG